MSERDSFSQCLVDGDQQSLKRARSLRWKALVASIIFEVALLAAMFLWPLITQGLPPQQFLITPTPPYHGGSNSPPGGSRAASNRHQPDGSTAHQMVFPIANIPVHAPASFSGEAPEIGSGFGPGNTMSSGIGNGGEDILAGGDLNVRPVPPPPPQLKPEKPRPMSEGVMEAALINKVQPQYPLAARLMHVEGTVRIQAIIGKDGRVRGAQVLSGNPILVQAALAAVREWRYRPTELNHEIVEVETVITVNFVLG